MEMETIDNIELIESYLKFCKRKRMSNHTIEGYKSSLYLFNDFITKKHYNLQNLDKKICERYIDFLNDKKISYSTLKNRFSTYNSFYEYLKYDDKVEANVIRTVSKNYLPLFRDNGGEN